MNLKVQGKKLQGYPKQRGKKQEKKKKKSILPLLNLGEENGEK